MMFVSLLNLNQRGNSTILFLVKLYKITDDNKREI